MTNTIILSESINEDGLQLNPIIVNEDYCNEWNIRGHDYLALTYNGVLLRGTLYRKGGLGTANFNDGEYIMILKYVRAFYSKSNVGDGDPKHLEGRWCILNKKGDEKVVFDHCAKAYLVKNSCIYTLDNKYYNIETGELYCNSYNKIESKEYVFLDNQFDEDESKKGVMRINKKTGTFIIYK